LDVASKTMWRKNKTRRILGVPNSPRF